MSNVISDEKRLVLLAALVTGNSERGGSSIATVDRETVGRYALLFGTGARYLHNAQAFGLSTPDIEQDEVWSFVGKKQARASPEEQAAGFGEAYTFVSLAMPSRYVISWKTGKRDQETANAFEADTRARLVVMPAIASDGFMPYPLAIGTHFGPGVDYAQIVKNYHGGDQREDRRYEPSRKVFQTKHVVFGAPDIDKATTAHIERNNGTMRHFIGRMRRLVYAFSKDPAHHAAAISLAYVYYNLCWIPRTMRITPGMAIGVTSHPWDLPELLDALMTAKPCEAPKAQPLAPRKPQTTARELPNGRGFLRIVQSGGASHAAPSTPAPSPPAAPAAPAPVEPSADATGQLDLLSWRPRSRPLPSPGTQLDLF